MKWVVRLSLLLLLNSALLFVKNEGISLAVAQTQLDVCTSTTPFQGNCAPPWKAVNFAEYAASNDGVALDGLLEAAGYGWSDNRWVDVAAGNFCGGAEQEIVVVQNQSPYFSVLRGPTPFLKATTDLGSQQAHPWRAIDAGNFDNDDYQEIVAVRKVSAAGIPDMFIINITQDCKLQVASTRAVGNPEESDWMDVAIGNFDDVDQQEIALVKNRKKDDGPYFVFLRFVNGAWNQYLTANLGSSIDHPWQVLAAGNLDGASGDELVAVRKVSDGVRNTVRAYRWDSSTSNFSLFATSTVSNRGYQNWSSAVIGNFGGDEREAIVLAKDEPSHLIVLDYPQDGDATLRMLAQAELDSVPGQNWRNLAAADWLDEDQGYDELIIAHNLQSNPEAPDKMHQADFMIYGNLLHRAVRASALTDTEAVIAGNEIMLSRDPETWAFQPVEKIKAWLVATHSNTYNVELRLPGEYQLLVTFLEATSNFCVDGRQLRIWITLPGPSLVKKGYKAIPTDSSITSDIAELDYFTSDDPDELDYLAWAALISRLAQRYPHIVAVSIDDFLSPHNLDEFSPDYVAELQSRLRWPSEWLSFVPAVYYDYFENGRRYPDLPLMTDSLLFYFVNYKHGILEKDKPVPEESVLNLPEEIADMIALLPDDRDLHFGAYLSQSFHGIPSIQVGYNLLTTALKQRRVTGATVYTGSVLWGDKNPPPASCETAFDHRFCVVQSVYDSHHDSLKDSFTCSVTYLPTIQR